MAKLLASSPTLAGIESMINRFWYSSDYRVNPETLAIEHPERDVNGKVRVVKKAGRYRFEMVESTQP